jgi:sialate O-acetylesterase
MIMNIKSLMQIIIFLILFSVSSLAQVKLPKLISDGMVLQQDTEIKLWGWASKDENVKITFLDETYNTTADSNGEWSIMIPKLKAGGPFEMKIDASNSISINDILIGEVWLCSGQSNMEITMQRVSPLYADEIAASENSSIRYFEVPDKYNFKKPQKNFVSGSWLKVAPENLLKFSAVSYFFGKEINDKYNVPVGLINAALGGSPAESWISEEGLKEFPKHYEEAIKFKDSSFVQKIKDDDKSRSDDWYKRQSQNDEGYSNFDQPWSSPDLNSSDWSTMTIPGYWADESLGNVNGVVWLRREIDIPKSLAGKFAKLNLGRIIDADSTFVNGTFVGNITYQYPPRRYTVPSGVLKVGKNTIVVRVISNIGKGGFDFGKPYELIVGDEKINLQGEWRYKLGVKMEPLLPQTFIRWKPVGLYNAMIAPLLDYKIKGVIWYQGESNARRPVEYRTLFPAVIKDWRKNSKRENLPFLFVQLPNFMEAKSEPSESNWALLREAQLKTLSLPNTGMAVVIDIGEWNDIHPLNKKDVGARLFLAADKVAYGNEIDCFSGPIYKSMEIMKDKVILSFDNVGEGLVVNGEKLGAFAIAGNDKHFVWAQAKIENNKIIVWSEKISNPVAVRYAWADNPTDANLYNKCGLPASPFRTDKF